MEEWRNGGMEQDATSTITKVILRFLLLAILMILAVQDGRCNQAHLYSVSTLPRVTLALEFGRMKRPRWGTGGDLP